MSDPNEDDPLARFLVTEIAEEHLQFVGKGSVLSIATPKTVKRECVPCGAIMSWDLSSHILEIEKDRLLAVSYKCRNCKDTFGAWIAWAVQRDKLVFQKCGQNPKFEVNPPKNLEKSLGGYVAFWRTGMTLRHHGYGLGALVYFRRIVEHDEEPSWNVG
jgi:hypothetical protein